MTSPRDSKGRFLPTGKNMVKIDAAEFSDAIAYLVNYAIEARSKLGDAKVRYFCYGAIFCAACLLGEILIIGGL